MAVLPDGRVFLTELRSGRILLYTSDAGMTEALKEPVYDDTAEKGMLGIAVDPDFATSNWFYVFYSRKLPGPTYNAGEPSVSPHEQVVALYTFSGGKLTNPKEILISSRAITPSAPRFPWWWKGPCRRDMGWNRGPESCA